MQVSAISSPTTGWVEDRRDSLMSAVLAREQIWDVGLGSDDVNRLARALPVNLRPFFLGP